MKLMNKIVIAGVGLSLALAATLPASSQAAVPYLKLHISISQSSGAVPQVINLTCTPDSKKVPNARSICRQLLKAGYKSLKPTPRNVACSMIYGGAQTASITGRWGRKVVNAQFSRTNGCETARWANLSFLLGKF